MIPNFSEIDLVFVLIIGIIIGASSFGMIFALVLKERIAFWTGVFCFIAGFYLFSVILN